MVRQSLRMWMPLAFAAALGAAEAGSPSPAKLSAAEIVDKNVAARGGLDAWRAVQTMSLSGKLGAGGNQRATLQVPGQGPAMGNQGNNPKLGNARPVEEIELPFIMELKRPRKMRFELDFAGQTAVQVYDGSNGWKLRPFLNRRVVEPFTADELKTSSMQADLDGPLVDYAAKGTKVELAGTDKVEGQQTYKLKLTMKNGESVHVWIDVRTFLETKIEGQPRRLDGVFHPVEVYFRDYRAVSGLQIPFILETNVLPVARTAQGFKDPAVPPERIMVEKAVVNPKLDESRFGKPDAGVALSAR